MREPRAVAGGFNHLVQLQEKLPFISQRQSFRSQDPNPPLEASMSLFGVTVHPVDDVCPLRGERTPESVEKSTPKTPPGDRGNHSNTATIHTYFKCTLQFFIPFKILPLQPV